MPHVLLAATLCLAAGQGPVQGPPLLPPSPPDPTLGQWVLEREVELVDPEAPSPLWTKLCAPLEDGSFVLLPGESRDVLLFDLGSGELLLRGTYPLLEGLHPKYRTSLGEVLGLDRCHSWVMPRARRAIRFEPNRTWNNRRALRVPTRDSHDAHAPSFVDLPGDQVTHRAQGWWCSKDRSVVALDERFREVGGVRTPEGPATFRKIGDLDADQDGFLAVLESRSLPAGLCGAAYEVEGLGPDRIHIVDPGGTVQGAFELTKLGRDHAWRVQLGARSVLVLLQALGREHVAYELTRDGQRAEPLRLYRQEGEKLSPLELPRLDAQKVWLDDAGATLTVLLQRPCRVLTFRRKH